MSRDSELDFFAAVRLCLRKYANFQGRAPRAEFWWWALFQWLAGSALNMIAVTLTGILIPHLAHLPAARAGGHGAAPA
jgi:uncharacterized membrane protein YhaH (DUF805 family)